MAKQRKVRRGRHGRLEQTYERSSSRGAKSAIHKRRKEEWEGRTISDLPTLVDTLQIPDWDWIIVGDGSGTTWQRAVGWATTVFDRLDQENPKVLWGAQSLGTNVVGELQAYLMAMQWLVGSKQAIKFKRVHIITDCEYLTEGSSNPFNQHANKGMWVMMDSFRRTGMRLRWHWMPRDVIQANRFCHNLANIARKGMKGMDEQATEQTTGELEVPSDDAESAD